MDIFKLKVDAIFQWDKLAFVVFLASGTFAIFFSFLFLREQFISPAIFFIYLLPFVMILPCYYASGFKESGCKISILFIMAIILLAIINVIMSYNPFLTLIAMRLFLISGIIPFGISLLLITNEANRRIFYGFCSVCLLIISSIEIIAYLVKGNFILMQHSIPLGTLLILLSLGPLHMVISKSMKIKIVGFALMLLGMINIIITQKRGAWLAIIIMSCLWISYRYFRKNSLILLLSFTIALSALTFGKTIYNSLNPNLPPHNSILHRLELYPFAYQIFKENPLFGIGLRSYTHQNFLPNYQQENYKLDNFKTTVGQLQTFENMLITSFVELGGVMTIVYLGLIIYVLKKYINNTKPLLLPNNNEFMSLLPLIGFAIHSMTYDSLMFPPINWLFHVQLGILAGYRNTD